MIQRGPRTVQCLVCEHAARLPLERDARTQALKRFAWKHEACATRFWAALKRQMVRSSEVES